MMMSWDLWGSVRGKVFGMVAMGVVMATLFFARPALSAIIVVDQNGGGDYRTIGEGIRAATAGDTVKVLSGIYEEALSINKNITLIGEGPDTTTIRNPGGTTITIGANVSSRISGFVITGGLDGFYIDDEANVVIENNLIVDNSRHGINVKGYYTKATVSAVNNTIIGNGSSGIWTDSNNSQLLVSNNIISNNGEYGIRSYSGEDLSANYNDVYNNKKANSDTSLNDTNLSSDPRFVNASIGNYHLRADSPCIDEGRPSSASDSDPDGSRPDMGAWGGPGAINFWISPTGVPIVIDLSVTPGSVPKGGKVTIRATGQIR